MLYTMLINVQIEMSYKVKKQGSKHKYIGCFVNVTGTPNLFINMGEQLVYVQVPNPSIAIIITL